MRLGAVQARVQSNRQLRAIWIQKELKPMALMDTLARPPSPVVMTNSQLADALMRQNREIMRNGLRKAGIKDSTLEKLKIFEEFAPNAGEYLIASMDLSHRMMMFSTVKLQERALAIEEDYLDNATLDEEIKLQWQQAYNEIVDLIGKNFERTLAATQAMAKMMGGKDDEKAVKPKTKFGALQKRKLK